MSKKQTNKQPSPGDENVPLAPEQSVEDRKGSRHKPRKMISISPRQYELIKQLARRNKRPLAWEVRIAINAALVQAGLMTQEQADAADASDSDDELPVPE